MLYDLADRLADRLARSTRFRALLGRVLERLTGAV